MENNATYEDIVEKVKNNGDLNYIIENVLNGAEYDGSDAFYDFVINEGLSEDEYKIKYNEALSEIKPFIEKNKDVKFIFDKDERNVLKDLFDNLISALSSRDINKIINAYNKLEGKLDSYNLDKAKKDEFKK